MLKYFIMLKCVCLLSLLTISCKEDLKNIESISSWSRASKIPTKDVAVQLGSQRDNWITFLYKGDVYVTTEDSTIPEPINIHKIGLEKVVGCRKERGIRSIKKVDDGYLVGFCCGEFGGGLCLFSNKGDYLYEILNREVPEIVNRKGKFYAISELGDTGYYNTNTIIEIKKKGTRWIVEKYLDLPSSAASIDIDEKGNLIVITTHQLLKIDNTKSIHVLIKDGFWQGSIYGSLSPNSVTVKNEIVFVGMTGGVLQYDIEKNSQIWLVKNKP